MSLTRFLMPVLAVLALSPTPAAADTADGASVDVTFNAALTNETAWTYSDGFGYVSSKKKFAFTKANANADQVVSPTFDFAVTSIVIRAEKASDKTTRKMSIRATSGTAGNEAIELVDGVVPQEQVAFTSVWTCAASDAVRSFALLTTGGSGNLYLESATISGVPFVSSPTGLEVSGIRATSFRLSWTNPDAAVSNRIDVSQVVEGSEGIEYDFETFSNSSSSVSNVTDKLVELFPKFGGSSVIRLPTNTVGVIQISTSSSHGYLVHSGFENCSELSMTVSSRRPHKDAYKNLIIGYESPEGTTNNLGAVEMTTSFQMNEISLAGLPDNMPLIINTQTQSSDARVEIDYLAFNWCAKTNFVKSVFATKNSARINGLSPSTEYAVSVTAFDSSDIESRPSDPVEARTADADPGFVIVIQ